MERKADKYLLEILDGAIYLISIAVSAFLYYGHDGQMTSVVFRILIVLGLIGLIGYFYLIIKNKRIKMDNRFNLILNIALFGLYCRMKQQKLHGKGENGISYFI